MASEAEMKNPGYHCQICGLEVGRARASNHARNLIYIAKTDDLFSLLDDEQIHDPSQTNCAIKSVVSPVDLESREEAAMFMDASVLRIVIHADRVDKFYWITYKQRDNMPYRAMVEVGQISSDKPLPHSLAFPICGGCSRLVRNFLVHAYSNRSPWRDNGLQGYDLLYASLLRRFLDQNKGQTRPPSLYSSAHENVVGMIGRAIVVRTPPGATDSRTDREATDPEADIFSQIPSLPRWMLSKLQRMEPDAECENKPWSGQSGSESVPHVSNAMLNLPLELLQHVAFFLDRPSKFALRLAHRRLASGIPLDQAFWYREFLYGNPPLFGFEPLYSDTSIKATVPGTGVRMMARIDSIEEISAQFKQGTVLSISKKGDQKDPEASRIAKKVRKSNVKNWSDYDWKGFVGLMARSQEFEEGGMCDDAPESFRQRRLRWSLIERLVRQL